MSSAQPNHSNRYIILFVTVVCFICALVLSILASVLKPLQDREEELYQSKQLLISAKILNYDGQFLVTNADNQYIAAYFDPKMQMLVPSSSDQVISASKKEIFALQKLRVVPMLTDSSGMVFTFNEKGINYEEYLTVNQKYGYAHLKLKLLYYIYPNLPFPTLKSERDTLKPVGYVIPINGYGLWDAIYGYLAIEANCNTIIGTTWYDQKETPGLGANIATPEWQKQFHNKIIFRPTPNSETHLESAKLGITIVKTTVKDELGNSKLAKNAVDGIAGATVTRNGVQEAYKQSLAPYRNFLLKAHQRYKNQLGGSE